MLARLALRLLRAGGGVTWGEPVFFSNHLSKHVPPDLVPVPAGEEPSMVGRQRRRLIRLRWFCAIEARQESKFRRTLSCDSVGRPAADEGGGVRMDALWPVEHGETPPLASPLTWPWIPE
jgi:hypothetical protein